jgi:hypothetical protein
MVRDFFFYFSQGKEKLSAFCLSRDKFYLRDEKVAKKTTPSSSSSLDALLRVRVSACASARVFFYCEEIYKNASL